LKTALIQGFYLGDVLVEPLKGLVTDRGEPRHVRPKAVEVLLHLAARPGDVVTHEELLAEIWGDGDAGHEPLSHAVSELRHALDDHPDNPKFVQTLRGRGYRLAVDPCLTKDRIAHAPSDKDDKSENLPIFAELSRRGVVQAGLAYLLVGWLLIQVGDATFSKLSMLPWWSAPFLTILVIIGFPIALVLAWFLEFAEGRWYIDPGHETKPPTRSSKTTYVAVVGALAVAAVGLSVYRMNAEDDSLFGTDPAVLIAGESFRPDVELPIRDNSIAVLPFLNIDNSPETQIFADGLSEDVRDQLARVPGLHVSSRRDSWSLPVDASSQDVRDRLRVAYYLQGSVRLDGQALRVVVELVDSLDGSIVLPRSFEDMLDDIFLIQEQITRLTVASLRVALPSETQTILTINEDKPSLDAYVLYRKGKTASELPITDETTASAVDYFEAALAVDPDYAAAHAGLCQAFVAGYESRKDGSLIEKAETACAAAIATNASIDLVYDALGKLYRVTGKNKEAEIMYDRALEINENDVHAMQGLAQVYRRQDRLQAAEEMHHRSINMQPGNWRSINNLGGFLFGTGRYSEAAVQYRQLVFLDRENWQGHGNLGSSLLMAGDFEQAIPALQRSIEIEPRRVFISNLGIIYYYLGRFDESVATHRKAVELAPDASSVWLNLGDALQFSSEPDGAGAAFEKAAEVAGVQLAVNPREAESMLDLAWAQAMLGDMDLCGELIAQSIKIAPSDPYGYYYLALLETKRGQKGPALHALELAVEKGYPTAMLAAEPYLDDLKNEERFAALLTEDSEKDMTLKQ
jgi:TolB-like protein/Tfp pilus assembly protein PilF/DNA-binding winged helix-turn-helix (wHTH) protein